MTLEEKQWRVRNMVANHAMNQLYQDTAALADNFGFDNAIRYLKWQIDCIRDMKAKAENHDEELYA